MCGIAGFWEAPTRSKNKLNEIASSMASAISHRGPDDSGVWSDQEIGIALGHQRLSIIDLSQTGHQPMVSSTGRFIIVFNGEIYNHLELRAELDCNSNCYNHQRVDITKLQWRGHSDTETLLAGFEQWGVATT